MASTINVPLTLSIDTRGVASFTNQQAGKDQRRVNCHYEITRTSINTEPDISVSRRPGVTDTGSTFGVNGQVVYLVGRAPDGQWNQTPWVFVKDGNITKVASSSTTATILNSADFQPRFWDVTSHSGTNYIVVQLQNVTTPSATPAQRVYFSSGDISTWTEINDAQFTALSHRGKMIFMDGRAYIMDSFNRIYGSETNNQASWEGLFETRSSTLDYPQGLMMIKNIILAGGTDIIELFHASGEAVGIGIERIQKSEHHIGIGQVAGGGSSIAGNTEYSANVGDWCFFVGRYGGAQHDASLIAFNGSRFEKISKPHEDTLISSTRIYSVNKVTFGGKVAVALQTTAPTATTQKWLMFFPDINEFFEWESTVFGPVNNNRHYAGSTDEQKLYTFEASDNWQDAGTSYTMTVQFKLPTYDLRWKTMTNYGLIGDTASSAQNVAVSFSNDNGQSYTTARNIDMSATKKELWRGGVFRERMVRLTHSGSGEVRLRRFFAGIE